MKKTSLFMLAALVSHTSFAAVPVVEEILADPFSILDAQGKLQQELPLSQAPKTSLPILQYNEDMELVQVELGGKNVWLDTMDLRMNPSKIVTMPCQKMPTSQASDLQNNSTIGYGATCNK